LTVTDTITGLVWQRDGSGTRAGCSGGVDGGTDGTTCTLAEAKAYCSALALGGVSGWRLPARGELLTIVDFTQYGPSINATAFPNTPSGRFWTSSPHTTPGLAWWVTFQDGKPDFDSVGLVDRVRCVR
jgi:hypothetical protein